jgi:hypothetical protein
MVSANKAGFDLRETFPLPRNILHRWGVVTPSDTGQRASLKDTPEGYRGWSHHDTSPKALTGYLHYPVSARDTAESVRHEARRWNGWKRCATRREDGMIENPLPIPSGR